MGWRRAAARRPTREFVDRFLFTRALDHAESNYSAAAEVLGIARQTMRVSCARRRASVGLALAHAGQWLEATQARGR